MKKALFLMAMTLGGEANCDFYSQNNGQSYDQITSPEGEKQFPKPTIENYKKDYVAARRYFVLETLGAALIPTILLLRDSREIYNTAGQNPIYVLMYMGFLATVGNVSVRLATGKTIYSKFKVLKNFRQCLKKMKPDMTYNKMYRCYKCHKELNQTFK